MPAVAPRSAGVLDLERVLIGLVCKFCLQHQTPSGASDGSA